MPYYNGRWHLYDERERREYGERKRQERSQDWHARWISKQGLKNRLWTDKAISSFLSRGLRANGTKTYDKNITYCNKIELFMMCSKTKTYIKRL
ncbi:hypothetical protein DQ657_25320 [Salmonella enterica]|nr:hypothetical protein [Salmonella enterica]